MKSSNLSPSIRTLDLKVTPRFCKDRVFERLVGYQSKLHIVSDCFQVDIGYAPPPHRSLSDTFFGILCAPADPDAMQDPSLDLLLQFEPVVGHGTGDNLRPSVLYWRKEFWTHILDLGDQAQVLAAVLYRVEVRQPPMADLFDLTDRNKM